MTLTAGLRGHVTDDQVEGSTQDVRADLEGVERTDLGLRRQGNVGIVEVDAENSAARSDSLCRVQRPGARTRSEIEDAVALLEKTHTPIDFFELVDRAGGITFTPSAASVVILLAARGQLSLFGGFRRFVRGLCLGPRLGKRRRRLLDGALNRDEPITGAGNAAI